MSDPREGTTVTHRRYIPYSHAHYAGDLVDGAYVLGLFGDAATELCIRTDGDEGLFASYSDVQFRAPVRAGDVLRPPPSSPAPAPAAASWTSRRGWCAGAPRQGGVGRGGAARAGRRRHRVRHRRGVRAGRLTRARRAPPARENGQPVIMVLSWGNRESPQNMRRLTRWRKPVVLLQSSTGLTDRPPEAPPGTAPRRGRGSREWSASCPPEPAR